MVEQGLLHSSTKKKMISKPKDTVETVNKNVNELKKRIYMINESGINLMESTKEARNKGQKEGVRLGLFIGFWIGTTAAILLMEMLQ